MASLVQRQLTITDNSYFAGYMMQQYTLCAGALMGSLY